MLDYSLVEIIAALLDSMPPERQQQELEAAEFITADDPKVKQIAQQIMVAAALAVRAQKVVTLQA